MTDAEIISSVIATATPLIHSIVDVYVKPKLEKLRDGNNVNFSLTEKDFNEYFLRTFRKLSVMNTLVFRNSQLLLTDVYIPLSINKKANPRDKETTQKTVIVDNFPKKLSDEFHNILITDTAGMGKSTMMKKIFLSAINEKSGIPLFIELRRLNKNKKLLDEIQEQLNSLEKNFDKDLLLKLLAQGDFIIILDGYDEITLSDRDVVTADIQDFIANASDNRFFLTSRPEDALSCFGNFQEFVIGPLTKNQAFELLRKYDNQGTVSSLLIDKLKEEDTNDIDEFLTNPLLVSLLFIAFEHKQTIPLKKYLFYRQVFDAYFEAHDLTKGDSYVHDKYSKLSIDDFHRVLRHIGYSCFIQQRIEFPKDELLELIKESKKFCVGLSFNESDLLSDLLKTVPLFTQDGNYYRWAHKSLSEYFAAQFIYMDVKELQNSILLKMYEHPQMIKFMNVLDLYYDMDYKTFRNIIEYRLLTEYFEYILNSYNSEYKGVLQDAILERKQLMFFFEKVFIVDFVREDIHSTLSDIDCPIAFTTDLWNVGVAYNFIEKRNVIMILLFGKNNPLVQPLANNNSKIHIGHKFTKKSSALLITDDAKNKLNSSINFQLINFLLRKVISNVIVDVARKRKKRFKNNGVIIDHKVALEKYEEIKVSIEEENNGELLMNF